MMSSNDACGAVRPCGAYFKSTSILPTATAVAIKLSSRLFSLATRGNERNKRNSSGQPTGPSGGSRRLGSRGPGSLLVLSHSSMANPKPPDWKLSELNR